jgi:hypothetical protein
LRDYRRLLSVGHGDRWSLIGLDLSPRVKGEGSPKQDQSNRRCGRAGEHDPRPAGDRSQTKGSAGLLNWRSKDVDQWLRVQSQVQRIRA